MQLNSLILIFVLASNIFVYPDFQLVDVEKDKKEIKEVDGSFKNIHADFCLHHNLEDGRIQLGIILKNNSDREVKVSRNDLSLDESYVFIVDGKELPYVFNNHQASKEIDLEREKLDLRWLHIPANGRLLCSVDIASWEIISGLESDKQFLRIKFYSQIFGSEVVWLKFRKLEK